VQENILPFFSSLKFTNTTPMPDNPRSSHWHSKALITQLHVLHSRIMAGKGRGQLTYPKSVRKFSCRRISIQRY